MTPGYPIVLETEPDGGYSIECPSLPGCSSEGETLEAALANIDEAIQLATGDETSQPAGMTHRGDRRGRGV